MFIVLNKGTTGTILLYDTVLDRGLNPGPPVFEARTLSLGYQGGGKLTWSIETVACY